VRKFITSWRELVASELKVCLQDGFAPARIFITGGGSLLLQYKESFAEISVVQPTSLQDFFENASVFGGPEDFTLACLVLLMQADSHLPALIDSYA